MNEDEDIVKEISPIEIQLEDQNRVIARMNDVLDNLERNLDFVLIPEVPAEKKQEEKSGIANFYSPGAKLIFNNILKIERLIEKINRIKDRLEI